MLLPVAELQPWPSRRLRCLAARAGLLCALCCSLQTHFEPQQGLGSRIESLVTRITLHPTAMHAGEQQCTRALDPEEQSRAHSRAYIHDRGSMQPSCEVKEIRRAHCAVGVGSHRCISALDDGRRVDGPGDRGTLI